MLGKRKADVIRHFKRRIWERFHMDITDQEYHAILAQIKKGQSVCVQKQSLARSVHKIVLRGETLLVVYNKEKHLLHTAFPQKFLPEYHPRNHVSVVTYSGMVL